MKTCPTGKLSLRLVFKCLGVASWVAIRIILKIMKREFVNIYKEFFPDGEPQNFAEWVFRAFDTKNQEIFIKMNVIRFAY